MKGDRGRRKIQQQPNTETGDGFQIAGLVGPMPGMPWSCAGMPLAGAGEALVPSPTPRAASALLFAPVSGEGSPCLAEHLAPEEMRTGLGCAHFFLLWDQAHLLFY